MGDRAVRISVCTPTYQGLLRLRITVPRVLEVLGPDDEVIYSLDGSNDGSEEYLTSLAAHDSRIVLEVSERNSGRTEALNAACRRAQGDVVLRLDDDILVPDRFFDLHFSAHDGSSDPVGVVQPLMDVFDEEPGSGMWRAFVLRNALQDRMRFEADPKGLPSCMWGPVCSVRRAIGQQLNWYDGTFDAYGWEDVEFGYRLRQSGVRLVSIDEAAVEHLVHWTSFRRKLERGFDSGARMAVFAQIHGPVAVLEALGRDPEGFRPPLRLRAGWAPDGRLRTGTSIRISVWVERLLALTRWRRGYDWWVARRLNWAYASGWYRESARMGLPCMAPPTQWSQGVSETASSTWERIVAAWYLQGDALRPHSHFAMRSAWLRHMEAGRISWLRALKHTLSSGIHAASLMRPRRRKAALLAAAMKDSDVWLLIEAPTPSQGDGAIAVAHAFESAGLTCAVLAANPKTVHWIASRYPACKALCLEDVVGLRALGSTRHLISTAGRAVRNLVRGAGLDASGLCMLQLQYEAASGAILAQGLDALPDEVLPRLVVGTSEYFAASIALRASMQRRAVPFVTLQHGAINAVYAPFFANEYWVWNTRSAEALRCLQPTGTIRVVGDPRSHRASAVDRSAARALLGLGDPDTPVVVFFSQTHGFEYSVSTHFAVAAQIARLRYLVPRSMVIIKRHPSERRSMLESLCDRDARVFVAPTDLSAAEVAAAADVAIALGSTALIDAAAVGCCAVELLSAESVVLESVSADRVSISRAADRLTVLLTDSESRTQLLERQSQWLTREHPNGSFESTTQEAAMHLIARNVVGAASPMEGTSPSSSIDAP